MMHNSFFFSFYLQVRYERRTLRQRKAAAAVRSPYETKAVGQKRKKPMEKKKMAKKPKVDKADTVGHRIDAVSNDDPRFGSLIPKRKDDINSKAIVELPPEGFKEFIQPGANMRYV